MNLKKYSIFISLSILFLTLSFSFGNYKNYEKTNKNALRTTEINNTTKTKKDNEIKKKIILDNEFLENNKALEKNKKINDSYNLNEGIKYKIINGIFLKRIGFRIKKLPPEKKHKIKIINFKNRKNKEKYPYVIEKEGKIGVFMSYNDKSYYWNIEDLYNKDRLFHNYIKELWENNTKKIVEQYSNSTTCVNFSEKGKIGPITGEFFRNNGIYLYLSKNDLLKFIGCYISKYEERENNPTKIKSTIYTGWKYYREKNISNGLKTLDGIWKKGTELSAFDKIFSVGGYVSGFATRTKKDGNVESFKVYGGGVCGISTILFQNMVKIQGIDVLSRKPHAEWHKQYYNKLGLDATIYGGRKDGKASIDLIARNNTGNDIYISHKILESNKYKGIFTYQIQFTSLDGFNKNIIKIGKPWKNKYGRKCVNVDIINNGVKLRTYTSCYKNIVY